MRPGPRGEVMVGMGMVIRLLLLLLLLRGRGLSGVGGVEVEGRGGWLEVVLGVDEAGELVGKVFVVGVHFHRS
jgi:hypothetical protein